MKGSSTTFVVYDYQDFIAVYNSKNTLSKESKPRNKNSKEFVQIFDLPDISVDINTAKDIITSSISKDKMEMLSHTKGGYLRVQLYINPISGRVMEVDNCIKIEN